IHLSKREIPSDKPWPPLYVTIIPRQVPAIRSTALSRQVPTGTCCPVGEALNVHLKSTPSSLPWAAQNKQIQSLHYNIAPYVHLPTTGRTFENRVAMLQHKVSAANGVARIGNIVRLCFLPRPCTALSMGELRAPIRRTLPSNFLIASKFSISH